MYVQVRHALAHPVIDRHKRPLRPHPRLDRARKPLGSGEQRGNHRGGQIRERFVVRLGNQQAMARK